MKTGAAVRRCLSALAGVVGTVVAVAALGASVPPPDWQCSATGSGAVVPALAEAAREYLGRVEALYPNQVLGLVRAGDRFYLLNSRDIEWGERTRLNLLALRLHDAAGVSPLRVAVGPKAGSADRHGRGETYLTPERQALRATPGSSPPPGGFVCLGASRAQRAGLTRAPLGEISLAAGQSVHLVDPQEPLVAVEVRAAQDRALSLGEILHRSARAGIFAGLAGQARAQGTTPGAAAPLHGPGGSLIVRTASIGGWAVETRVAALEAAYGADERQVSSTPALETVSATVPKATVAESATREPASQAESARAEVLMAAAAAPLLPSAPREKVAAVAPPRDLDVAQTLKPAPELPLATLPVAVTAALAPRVDAAVAVEDPKPVAAVAAAVTAPAPSPVPVVIAAIPESAPPAPAATALAEPAEIAARPLLVALARPSAAHAAPEARPVAEPAYDDYAKAMKTMMALRRPGSVRSVSEMTYVHPAVEVLRPQMR